MQNYSIQSQRGSNTTDMAPACIFLSVLAALFFGGALVLSELDVGRWAFAAALAGVLLVDASLWLGVVAKTTHSIALKIGFVVMVIYTLYPMGMALSIGSKDEYLFPWGEYIFQSPISAACSFLVSPVIITVIMQFTKSSAKKPGGRIGIRGLVSVCGPAFQWILIAIAILRISQWVAILDVGNPIFYFTRILNSALTFAPFLAGLCAFRFKLSTVVWVVVLLLGFGASAVTGARGYAFYPAMFYIAGFFVGLPNTRARFFWGMWVGVPCIVLMAIFGVYVGLIRDEVGRTDIKSALFGGQSVLAAGGDANVRRAAGDGGGAVYRTLKRLAIWAYPVIPAMSPNPIGYRGFDDLGREVNAAFSLGMIRGDFNSAGIYFSQLHLKPYGFAVHADQYVLISNVEMPVFTDGFTRGGWLAAIIMTFLAYLLTYSAEVLWRKILYIKYRPIYILITIVICKISVHSVHLDPLINVMRSLVMFTVFCALLFWGICIIFRRLNFKGTA